MDPVHECGAEHELLDEALVRAQDARKWLEQAAAGLGGAGGWALFDLLGGGWFSARRKHDHLDRVRSHLRRAQRELRSLGESCESLGIASVGSGPEGIRSDRWTRAIDTWVDDPFSDFRMHRRIKELKREVGVALGRLEGVTAELERRARR